MDDKTKAHIADELERLAEDLRADEAEDASLTDELDYLAEVERDGIGLENDIYPVVGRFNNWSAPMSVYIDVDGDAWVVDEYGATWCLGRQTIANLHETAEAVADRNIE